jgi:serine/threonine protein kinase
MHIQIGQVLEGKYVIDRLIGQGGMGAVYEGRNIRIERRVAIKVLHGAVAQQPEVVARFEREAQAAGRIGNDHIVEIIDLGLLQDGDRFIAMEYLDGEPLSARIQRLGRLGVEEARNIVLQVLAGVGAAHRAGIVHRDLKPDNVFVLREKAGRTDFVKIIDFGISKFKTVGSELRMTQSGVVMGTPFYMSPEQIRGEETDVRTDIYSTGVILYEAITGQRPFTAPSYNELILKIALSQCPPASNLVPNLSPELGAVLERSLARERDHRFQSAEQFAEALRRCTLQSEAGRTATVGREKAWGSDEGTASAASWSNTGPPAKEATRSRRALWLGLVAVTALVALAAALGSRASREETPSVSLATTHRRTTHRFPIPGLPWQGSPIRARSRSPTVTCTSLSRAPALPSTTAAFIYVRSTVVRSRLRCARVIEGPPSSPARRTCTSSSMKASTLVPLRDAADRPCCFQRIRRILRTGSCSRKMPWRSIGSRLMGPS